MHRVLTAAASSLVLVYGAIQSAPDDPEGSKPADTSIECVSAGRSACQPMLVISTD